MKTFNKAFYFPLLFLSLLFNLSNLANADALPFTSVKIDTNSTTNSVTINGSILQIGNQLLCVTGNTGNGNSGTDGGACLEPTEGEPNNDWFQFKAKVDTNATIYNSMAKLVMQAGDEVFFAKLYWSARAETCADAQSLQARQIQIKGPASTTYTQYIADSTDLGWECPDSFRNDYGTSIDITQYVKDNGAGEYYVGDILTNTGKENLYASWQLIVVVKNTTRSLKNIVLYDGYNSIKDESITVDATGFITPTGTDPFDANLFIYAGESDSSYSDSVQILDGNDVWQSLVDGAGTVNDVMNGSVSSLDYTDGYRSEDDGMASPNFRNVLGVDIDKLLINDKLDSSKQILSNAQGTTQIKLTSDTDRYSLNMFAFETEVFIPEFCYDYSYKQQGKYFTEENDGTQPPRLTGEVIPNEPIEVTLYIKSLVDGAIDLSDMTFDILDINTTQATYESDTTKIAKTGDLSPEPVTDDPETTISDIKNIYIGDLNQNEFAYIYYTLDPKIPDMNMSINAEASYSLSIDGGDPLLYTLRLSEDIPLCSTSNFEYVPEAGIFNIVHENYYNTNTQLYNLPTQITSRAANFKAISLDSTFSSLEDRNTSILVELIDASAFHSTEISCNEEDSAISEGVWITFSDSSSISFTAEDIINNQLTIDPDADKKFYKNATQNVAFRVGYPVGDFNTTTISEETSEGSGLFRLKNFTEYAGDDCVNPVVFDQKTGGTYTTRTYTKVPDACGNSGTSDSAALTQRELNACLQCIYGSNIVHICSRDNFSLRPEAFLLKLNDQNQTNTSSKLRIADDVTGVTGIPNTAQVELAAGYNYNLEVNATNHYNSEASPGYTKTFGIDSTDIVEYQWSPTTTLTGCNDETNSTITFKMRDGDFDLNTSLSQVGEYKLHAEDTFWTTVDNDINSMTHHSSSAFLKNADGSIALDCLDGVTTTQIVPVVEAEDATPLNGCNISSNHNASYVDAGGLSLKYRDYNVEFHPYKFSVTNTMTLGENNISVPITNPFVYMADINVVNDENMSVHLNSTITALGKDNIGLTNFVTSCYAKPLDLNISNDINVTSTISTNLDYRYIFHDLNSSGTVISANDINNSILQGTTRDINIITGNGYFQKHMNGAINTRANMNFNREINASSNPERITFITYNVANLNNTFNADLLTNKTGEGNVAINQAINHYYGRTAAKKTTVICKKDDILAGTCSADGTEDKPFPFIYYEVFCTAPGCDQTLLPTDSSGNISQKVDSRWFINFNHTAITYGEITAINESVNNYVTVPALTYANPMNSVHTYDMSDDLPYTATMLDSVPNWLLHNENNASATTNSHIIIFRPTTEWSGEHEADSTTKTDRVQRVNRRTMW